MLTLQRPEPRITGREMGGRKKIGNQEEKKTGQGIAERTGKTGFRYVPSAPGLPRQGVQPLPAGTGPGVSRDGDGSTSPCTEP